MTALLVICVIVLFTIGVYLMLGRELKGVAMGLFLFSHAANLGILAMSGQPLIAHAGSETTIKSAPVIGGSETIVDPLPQALILTAIVISLAVTAFILTLLVVTHRRTDTLQVNSLADEDRPSAAVLG